MALLSIEATRRRHERTFGELGAGTAPLTLAPAPAPASAPALNFPLPPTPTPTRRADDDAARGGDLGTTNPNPNPDPTLKPTPTPTPNKVAISAPLLRHLLSERQAALMAGCATTLYFLLTTYYSLLIIYYSLLATTHYRKAARPARARWGRGRGAPGHQSHRPSSAPRGHRARARRPPRRAVGALGPDASEVPDLGHRVLPHTGHRCQVSDCAERRTDRQTDRETSNPGHTRRAQASGP